MSPAEGVNAILEAANIIGGGSGWASYVGKMGTSTSKSVTVIDQGGRGAEVGVAIDYPGIQVLVKGDKSAGGYTAAYQKTKDVFNALQTIPQNPAAWAELISCVVRGGIIPLGDNDTGQPMFSLNFNLITVPAVIGYRS